MKPSKFRFFVLCVGLLFGVVFPALAQIGPELQMAELSQKLQLTDQQKKDLTPIVRQRDKQIKALQANASMGKLQKLRKAAEIQENFKNEAAKVLNPGQTKKLESLQAERRAQLTGH